MSERPVLLVTNLVPEDRVASLRALHERAGLEVAIYDGRRHHATGGADDPGVPHRRISQREAYGLAASGRYRAVIATSAGRLALPAAFRGARRAGVPFLYWTGIWHQVATPAHLAAIPLLRWIERSADGTIAYGEHVAAYARGHGSRNVVVAPQAVDGAFWGATVDPGAVAAARTAAGSPAFLALYVGRTTPGKGVGVLLDAWAQAGLTPDEGALALAGPRASDLPERTAASGGVIALGHLAPDQLRNLYAAADVLVVPSVPTRAFREPWALVVNEAMSQRTPVIATDAVGAAAGGLVRGGQTGFVVPAGDPAALASAITTLHGDAALRDRLGAAGSAAVAAYTPEAWADAVCTALATALSGDGGR